MVLPGNGTEVDDAGAAAGVTSSGRPSTNITGIIFAVLAAVLVLVFVVRCFVVGPKDGDSPHGTGVVSSSGAGLPAAGKKPAYYVSGSPIGTDSSTHSTEDDGTSNTVPMAKAQAPSPEDAFPHHHLVVVSIVGRDQRGAALPGRRGEPPPAPPEPPRVRRPSHHLLVQSRRDAVAEMTLTRTGFLLEAAASKLVAELEAKLALERSARREERGPDVEGAGPTGKTTGRREKGGNGGGFWHRISRWSVGPLRASRIHHGVRAVPVSSLAFHPPLTGAAQPSSSAAGVGHIGEA
jgi:hypothetical protein